MRGGPEGHVDRAADGGGIGLNSVVDWEGVKTGGVGLEKLAHVGASDGGRLVADLGAGDGGRDGEVVGLDDRAGREGEPLHICADEDPVEEEAIPWVEVGPAGGLCSRRLMGQRQAYQTEMMRVTSV